MDRILIIDIDSKIPNYALKKVERYHLDRGDEVIWNSPLWRNLAYRTYVSCVFPENRWKCQEWIQDGTVGGSGWNLDVVLPPEIESVKPRINLGFTTRGCIRKCQFCIVPKKEGKIRAVGDLLDLWDGKSRDIALLDNNILALPEHFKLICQQARENRIRIDFNQGLDHRLLNDEIVRDLVSIRHGEYRFSFDDPAQKESVSWAISILKKAGIKRCLWYVLVGFSTTFEEDLDRLNYLKSENQNVFVQKYNHSKDKKLIQLARWGNQHHIFQGMSWEQFCEKISIDI